LLQWNGEGITKCYRVFKDCYKDCIESSLKLFSCLYIAIITLVNIAIIATIDTITKSVCVYVCTCPRGIVPIETYSPEFGALLWKVPVPASNTVVALLVHFCQTVLALCYTVVELLLHCCNGRLLLHWSYNIVDLLSRCCFNYILMGFYDRKADSRQ
jgi:hypothetical protein